MASSQKEREKSGGNESEDSENDDAGSTCTGMSVTSEFHTSCGSGQPGTYHGQSHLALRMSASCTGGLKDVDKTHPEIWALLPKGYDYHICAIEMLERGNQSQYKIGIRLPIYTIEGMNKWVEEYEKVSYTGWRIGNGAHKSKAIRMLYQKAYKCKHNIYLSKEKRKPKRTDWSACWRGNQHTGCKAKLNVAIKVLVPEVSRNRRSRGTDVHMPDYPALVSITHTHNHDLRDEFALRFRSVDKSVENFYIDLFKAGHAPNTAQSLMQWKRWAEFGRDFESKTIDRAFNPDWAYVFRIFYRMMRKRKPHILKPVKRGKAEESSGTREASTPAPPLMEEDSSDSSPVKKLKGDAGASTCVNNESVINNSMELDSQSLMDDSSIMDNSSVLDNSSLPDNSAVGQTSGGDDEGIDFFGHGYKTRMPGSNKKRKNTVNLTELFEDLELLISKHVTETNPAHAHLARITGKRDDMIIAICTPLMRRAHTETVVSGELCIVDGMVQSFGQASCHVISFMTPSNAGGLPLGFIVLSSVEEVFISQGLELFKMLLPEDAFGGRGRDGPAHFLTDGDHFKAEILQGIFPESSVMISPYHLLLTTWRWLVDPKHRVEATDHSVLLELVKELVNCRSAEEIQSVHLKILGSDINDCYREFGVFVTEHVAHRWVEWMLPDDHPVHRIGIGVFPWEKVMNCLRDRVLLRGKQFNILQMTHFLLNGVDDAYKRNLVEGCNNLQSDLSFAPVFFDPFISQEGIKQINVMEYLVTAKSKNSSILFTVNLEMGVCSCHQGKVGYLCGHMAGILKYFSLPWNSKKPFECSKEKYQIYAVATGEKALEERLLDTMQSLTQVLEANYEMLKSPILNLIQQLERADSAGSLAKAMTKFAVLTQEEEEKEKEKEKKEAEEEKERKKREEARKRLEWEEEWKEREERKRDQEAVDTLLYIASPKTNQIWVKQEEVTDGSNTTKGNVTSPSRPMTRGALRKMKNNEPISNENEKPSLRSSGSPNKSTAAQSVKEKELTKSKDNNLIVMMSDKGGMLIKGIPTKTPNLGRVLVINRPITDQQVGMITIKEPMKERKGGKTKS